MWGGTIMRNKKDNTNQLLKQALILEIDRLISELRHEEYENREDFDTICYLREKYYEPIEQLVRIYVRVK